MFSLCLSAPCLDDYCAKNVKCTEVNETDCDLPIPYATKCGCCSICITQIKEGDSCIPPSLSNLGVPGKHCGPQMACINKKCRKKPTPCLNALEKYNQESNDGYLHICKSMPNCTEDGKYSKKLCRPGSMCYCVDQDGKRIFGETNDRREEVGCACSRKFHDLKNTMQSTSLGNWLKKDSNPATSFFRCSSDGDYNPLQCINDHCFCIDKKFKIVSRIVPLDDIWDLQCFNPLIPMETLKRPCEDVLERAFKYHQKQMKENKIVVGLDFPSCDLDGTYAPKQCKGDTCFCAFKNGTAMGGSLPRYSKEASQMKCECMRENLFMKTHGQVKELICTESGDYSPIQCMGSFCYCVDEFGEQKGPEFSRDNSATQTC